MRLYLLSGLVLYSCFIVTCSGTRDYQRISGRASEFVPSSRVTPWNTPLGREPSCEELRAMWRFSKRQSRASEMSNEISTYRDPFAYNVWEPHARSRSMGGGVLKGGGGGERGSSRPIYGRVVHAAPRSRVRENPPERIKTYDQVARHMVTFPDGPQVVNAPRRKVSAFRISGGHVPDIVIPPPTGSFQTLKEIIRAERVRELQEQRMQEEAEARSAALDMYSAARLPPQQDDRMRYGKRDDSQYMAPFPDYLSPGVEDDLIPVSAFA